MCKRNISVSLFLFFHSLYYDAAWDAIDWIRAEEPFRRLFDVSDTCPGLVFGPSRAPPTGPGGDVSRHKVVPGCMRRAYFLITPLALVNQPVERGHKQWHAWL